MNTTGIDKLMFKVLHDSEKYQKGRLSKGQLRLGISIIRYIERLKILKHLVKNNELFPYKDEYCWDFVTKESKKYENEKYEPENYLKDNKTYMKVCKKLYEELLSSCLEDDSEKLKMLEKKFLMIDEFNI